MNTPLQSWRVKSEKWFRGVWGAVRFAAGFVLLLWVIHLLTFLGLIDRVGIIPRTQIGAFGVLSAPLLHANLHHLVANSFAIIGFFILFSLAAADRMITVFTIIYIVHGLLVWLVARSGNQSRHFARTLGSTRCLWLGQSGRCHLRPW